LCLLDGTYQGAANMIAPPVGINGTSTARITVRALNDGGVFIDGQFARETFRLRSHSYWTFEGFDVGNSSGSVMRIGDGGPRNAGVPNPTNLTFRRICASNSIISPRPAGFTRNEHVWLNWTSVNSLYEDICGFGSGRNVWVDGIFNSGTGNTIRRAWFRHEGYPYQYTGGDGTGTGEICGGGLQPGYHDAWPYTGTNENWISADTYEQVLPSDTACYNPSGAPNIGYGVSQTYGSWASVVRGVIVYNRANMPQGFSNSIMDHNNQSLDTTPSYLFRDLFVDGRNYPLEFGPVWVRQNGPTPVRTFDRVTSLRHPSGNASQWSGISAPSTFYECTTLGACPNFYTGTPGNGSRACYQYQDGVLQDGTGGTTAKPLWPWPMDDRIKAALARARAAGRGGSALAGTAGPGYAANTVTSEIVSRYGAIPQQCLTALRTPSVPGSLQLSSNGL
jgi:hypothetical protein